MSSLLYLAATEAAHAESQKSDLFSALGIDIRLLILQAGAFLVLVLILGKFVYPHLLKAIDARRTQAEETAANAKKAQEALAQIEQKVADTMRSARADAAEMLERSQKEAASIIKEAETKATKRAEHIVSEARAQLDNDIRAARLALKQETTALVAQATEKIIRQKVDAKKDTSLIESALKEAS